MYEDPKEKIERIIEEGYDFKFGDYISRGFEIAKKNWGGYIGFLLLVVIITLVISLIPFIGTIANSLFISPALGVGFYIVANKLWRNENTEFGDFFKGFDHIGQLALTALVQGLIIIAAMVPFIIMIKDTGLVEWYMETLNDPIGMQGTVPPFPEKWTFWLMLPVIYFGIAYSWSYKFVVFYKMQFWDAMESSRKLITKKWFIFLGFYIVIGLIGMAGMIALCIGLLFTLPAVYCMIYAAFEDITQLNAESEGSNDLEDHLVGG
ncbi:MAG: hypothetical protein AAFZ15_00325 [Bacteroidota bacterium]